MALIRKTPGLVTALLCVLSVGPPTVVAEEVDSLSTDPPGVHLCLRSVLIDGEYLLFSAGISGSVDVDVIHFRSRLRSALGIRFGIDHYSTGSPGGSTSGSPFTDYNVLLRHSASGRIIRLDFYGGYSYHVLYPNHGSPTWKAGLDIRVYFMEHFMSALGKISWPGGIGFSLGWERE